MWRQRLKIVTNAITEPTENMDATMLQHRLIMLTKKLGLHRDPQNQHGILAQHLMSLSIEIFRATKSGRGIGEKRKKKEAENG